MSRTDVLTRPQARDAERPLVARTPEERSDEAPEKLRDEAPVLADGTPRRAERPCLLRLRGVDIAYEDGRPAVSGIDFELHQGESVLFLGPSGCGKSTVAMLCAGLIPEAVEAKVTGEVVRHPSLDAPGAVGYVFQDPDAQFCMLRVDDEMAFGLENQGLARAEMAERIRGSLAQVGLAGQERANHAVFSGGMKQKLAIACALAMHPRLLILDEPTANLDPLATRQVFTEIARLARAGQTLLVIEHKFDALLPWMDRVVLFDAAGRVHRAGPTAEVIREEWDWLVAEGVVAPWKARPVWLDGSPEGGPDAPSGDAADTGAWRVAEPAAAPGAARSAKSAASAGSNVAEPAFSIRNGRLAYDGRLVWQDVSFDVPRGAFVAIVGPNGAGKSSLLQGMAGLQRLSGGEVRLFEREIRAWRPADRVRAVSYCFQNPEYQFIYERVADELANRPVGNEVPPETMRLLEAFGLAGCAKQSPFGLSQGQKRRLSVASMLREPHDVYLLDEPTFGQDARTQQAILDRLAALHQEGRTVVITTHDLDLVRRYATHVAVVADGGLLYWGSPAGLWQRPDVMAKAHLVDDVRPLEEGDAAAPEPQGGAGPAMAPEPQGGAGPAAARPARDVGAGPAAVSGAESWPASLAAEPLRKGLVYRLNPPWHLVTCVIAIAIGIFAHTLPEAVAMFLWPLVLLFGAARLSPRRVVVRLSPFLIFYVLYVWTLTAYARVEPGTRTLDFLWMHLSYPGFIAGLVLAFRMLGAVCFGVLFVTATDVTDLVVGLCQTFRVPPKFAYGTLAGIRFMPLFQSEWTKLRQARQLRGKDARWRALRPVTYALPLLAQAIRMSERVAIAMEARGFRGAPADRPDGRAYYRVVPVRRLDFAYLAVVCGISITLLWCF
ncbi:ATP-binding cassette domain-containing protein [Alicyclobacillus macrosporangiidus]|uniref:Energy-coupling factor transport system ATP-binding protein n=1 Tax=Alicyclobacillus macrosporangiidus TaxID=392015 RepID=A0A1I7FDF4_9BACL|nr:ATP-binding cassette domain-containing protein [Alicyclobacillus macrosporangiidus]SFU34126.1 energy-coupling factor transport system ATP-binding protein [Alicyclobacillus macrosporangiidus]